MLDQIRGSVDRPTQLVSDQSDTNTVAFSIEKLQMNCKTTVSCNAFQNRRASTGDPRVAWRLWASSPVYGYPILPLPNPTLLYRIRQMAANLPSLYTYRFSKGFSSSLLQLHTRYHYKKVCFSNFWYSFGFKIF